MALRILMVCLGNICRSPMAEAVLKRALEQAGIAHEIDSAGTSDWHSGESPDKRAIQVAKMNGIDISHQVARQLSKDDFSSYDLIFAMDKNNYRDILQMAPGNYSAKVYVFLEYAGVGGDPTVPDPYYGGIEGFEEVFELLESNCSPIIERILKEYGEQIS